MGGQTLFVLGPMCCQFWQICTALVRQSNILQFSVFFYIFLKNPFIPTCPFQKLGFEQNTLFKGSIQYPGVIYIAMIGNVETILGPADKQTNLAF